MAPKATVVKVELQVTDMDRHYYASHNLTLAQHPSETDERLMVRLLAFALYADERLEFGRGLSDEDDWRHRVRDACDTSRCVESAYNQRTAVLEAVAQGR